MIEDPIGQSELPLSPPTLKPQSPSEAPIHPPPAIIAESPTIPLPVSDDAATLAPPLAPSESETLIPQAPTGAATGFPTVPGYELLSELGRGGMGVVYQARHLKLNRLVALKMILAGSDASAADLARFQTEAQAIARFQHPNIVQVHEVGEHAGKPFFSLEFCGGGSLAQKLNGTPLPEREAAALVEKLARAMQTAHEQHVIHRDLKPANVLLSDDGVPKITDFGLAKKLDEAGQTQPGAIMGTPSYMAPEQAGGKSEEIGPAVDVYALGAIVRGGRIVGRSWASMVLPVPGLPIIRTFCPPAAETTKARLANSWPQWEKDSLCVSLFFLSP